MLSRSTTRSFAGAAARCSSLGEARTLAETDGARCLWVAGGVEAYHEAVDFADALYLTRVHAVVEGGVEFPHTWCEPFKHTVYERCSRDANFAYTFSIHHRESTAAAHGGGRSRVLEGAPRQVDVRTGASARGFY